MIQSGNNLVIKKCYMQKNSKLLTYRCFGTLKETFSAKKGYSKSGSKGNSLAFDTY